MNRRYIKVVICLFFSIVISVCSVPNISANAKALPAKYQSTTSVIKNQNPYGLCWAYASVAAIETELVKNNGADKSLDLSELHIAYFTANPTSDKLGQLQSITATGQNYDTGRNAHDVGYTLFNGVGLADESVTEAIVKNDIESIEKNQYKGNYYIKSMMLLHNKYITVDNIKNLVYKYGGVATDCSMSNSAYLNSSTNAYYAFNEDSFRDHAVCIVGWDDNYSKKNFNVTPPGDGAWIVKNSYGENWGDNGYFYISYYDKTTYEIAAFDVEPGKVADNLYQNCFNGARPEIEGSMMRMDNIEKAANVFIANANEKGAEKLTKVSFAVIEPCSYTLKIYKNLNNNANPESGTLALTQTGKIDYEGMQVIELENEVYLSEGEMYSIVLSTKTKEGKYIGVCTSGYPDETKATAVIRQSYAYTKKYPWDSNSKEEWIDYAAWEGRNVCIKAYTDNISADKSKDSKKVAFKIIDMSEYVFPDDVADVEVSVIEADQVTLSWKPSKAEGYLIYQYSPNSMTWKVIGSTKECFYTVNNLNPNTNYTFGVKNIDKNIGGVDTGYSMYAYKVSKNQAEVKCKTKEKDIIISVNSLDKATKLSWSKYTGATTYKIFVLSPRTDYEWEELKTIKTSNKSISYTDSTVMPGVEYMYRVYAYKGSKLLKKGKPVKVRK